MHLAMTSPESESVWDEVVETVGESMDPAVTSTGNEPVRGAMAGPVQASMHPGVTSPETESKGGMVEPVSLGDPDQSESVGGVQARCCAVGSVCQSSQMSHCLNVSLV